jgi:hypothetical protein
MNWLRKQAILSALDLSVEAQTLSLLLSSAADSFGSKHASVCRLMVHLLFTTFHRYVAAHRLDHKAQDESRDCINSLWRLGN